MRETGCRKENINLDIFNEDDKVFNTKIRRKLLCSFRPLRRDDEPGYERGYIGAGDDGQQFVLTCVLYSERIQTTAVQLWNPLNSP